MKKLAAKLLALLLVMPLMLAGCSGGGSDSAIDQGGVTTGVAVDPYIMGAVFVEYASGEVVQTSSPSDDNGRFSFVKALLSGSVVEMQTPGLHGGTPFKGLLKRNVDISEGTLVVSPLTTLVAEGMEPAAVVTLLETAGITGVTAEDINSDPMQNLAGKAEDTVTADDMKLLMAAMAVNVALNAVANDVEAPDLQAAVTTVATELTADTDGDGTSDLIEAVQANESADLDDAVAAAVVVTNYLTDAVEAAVISATPDAPANLTGALETAATAVDQAIVDATVAAAASGDTIALEDANGDGQIAPVTVSGSIAEFLNAGFAALDCFEAVSVTGMSTEACPSGDVEYFLSVVENFQAAGALVGYDQTADADLENQALFFSALTQVAALVEPYSDLTENGLNNFGDILDAFGISQDNTLRAGFDTIPMDTCGEVTETWTDECSGKVNSWTEYECDLESLASDSPSADELKQFAYDKVGTGLKWAVDRLKQVNGSFNRQWTDAADQSVTEFDESDALFLKGAVQAMLAELNLVQAYSLDVDLDAEQAAEQAGTETAETFLARNSNLGTLVDAAKLADAKTYIGSAATSLTAAVNAINAEYTAQEDQTDDLISFYSCEWDWQAGQAGQEVCGYDGLAVTETLDALAKVQTGLTSPVVVDEEDPANPNDDVVMNFYEIFNGIDLRDQIPTFVGDKPAMFPDASLGGVFADPTQVGINQDVDGDGSPDMIHDYTRFSDAVVAGKEGSLSGYACNAGGIGGQIAFDAQGGFTYNSNYGQIAYAGISSVDAAGVLVLTFTTPLLSADGQSQIETLRVELVSSWINDEGSWIDASISITEMLVGGSEGLTYNGYAWLYEPYTMR